MKFIGSILLIFLLLSGCTSKSNDENITKNPVEGRVFEFAVTGDLSLNPDNNNHLLEIAFLDEKKVILSYSENYEHKFVKGVYQLTDSIIDLIFEPLSYHIYYPELPATSAVDTVQYGPEIIEEKSFYTHIKLELTNNQQELRTLNNIRNQAGFLENDISLEDFKNGIRLQKLEFLLDE